MIWLKHEVARELANEEADKVVEEVAEVEKIVKNVFSECFNLARIFVRGFGSHIGGQAQAYPAYAFFKLCEFILPV